MRTLFKYYMFSFILVSCVTNGEERKLSKESRKPKFDTLFINPNTFSNIRTGDKYINKEYSFKGDYLPKSKNIGLNFTYFNSVKHIINNSKVILKSHSKDVIIKSVKGNNKFNLFIKDSYKDSILLFDFAIVPNKNYVYSLLYKSLSKQIDTFYIAQHLKYVEQR